MSGEIVNAPYQTAVQRAEQEASDAYYRRQDAARKGVATRRANMVARGITPPGATLQERRDAAAALRALAE
jgi:hypothetical protein